MTDLPIPGIYSPSGLETMLPFEEGIPILFEDDEEPEMGESNLHTLLDQILLLGFQSHLKDLPDYQVFDNLNLYYPAKSPDDRVPYVSPDVMIVRPHQLLPETLTSYRLYRDGPIPEVVVEILSEGTAQEVDLNQKVDLYRILGVREYILVDKYCDFLPQQLLLKRLGPAKTWEDLQDPDGGVTSLLGFRIVFDENNQVSVVNAETRHRYRRPDEAEQDWQARQREEKARQRAEQLLDQEAEARRHAEEARKLAETEKNVETKARKQAEKARKRAETDKLVEAEARKRAEADKLVEAEARKRAEADKLVEAEARKRAETDKQNAEEARKRAEADKLVEAEARKRAETGKQNAEKRAETDKQNAEEARKRAETDKQNAEEARKRAETDKQNAEEARKRAETDKQNAEEARKRAEDRIRKLEAELSKLRDEPQE